MSKGRSNQSRSEAIATLSVSGLMKPLVPVASMNGLDGFTRQAARELSQYGIKVYSVDNISEKIAERVFALLDLQMEER